MPDPKDDPAKLGPVAPMFPDCDQEPTSPMQQAILDSGAKPVEGSLWAYQTNQGVVFLASPADMARSSAMDAWKSACAGMSRTVF